MPLYRIYSLAIAAALAMTASLLCLSLFAVQTSIKHHNKYNNLAQVHGLVSRNCATSLFSAANYLPFGPLSGLSFGNAVTETWTHDKSYRATGISDVGAGAVGKISSLGYGYRRYWLWNKM